MNGTVGGVSLRKAYGGAATIWLAALLISLGFESAGVSLGLTAGTALALGVLASWQLIITKVFDPGAPKRGLAMGLGLVKLPVIGAILYVLIGRELVDPVAFAAGFLIPQVAIVLLALGRRMENMRKDAVHAAPRA